MKTIQIDHGHGGTDPGAVNGKRRECDDTLRLGALVGSKLIEQGQNVIYSRETDKYVSLIDRTNIANKANADMFVSLHRNSFTNSTANGVEIWVYTNPTAAELGAACDVLEELVKVGVQSNRGVKKGNYHVCRETKMPAMLIELGFISNAKDNELFDKNLDAYATAIVKGILEALGEPYKEPNNAQNEAAQGVYRVQVGAFTVKDNAESFLKTVKGMGLQAFLVMPDTAKGD